MMALNMAEQGILGEIVHCKGGYLHDLRDEVSTGGECRHYRLRNYLHRNVAIPDFTNGKWQLL